MNLLKTKLPLVAAAYLLAACSHFMNANSVDMTTAAEGIPAAQGAVKTMDGQNDNKRVLVSVEHLAPPEKVAEGATTYVVWAQPTGADTVQNIGALNVDKKLKGTLMTQLPYENFKVFITAEPTAQATQPTGEELLAANVK